MKCRLLVLSAFLVGCSSALAPSDRLAAITRSIVYQAGDTVVVRLLNLSNERLSYTTCQPTLMRQDASGWVAVAPESFPCGGVGRFLAAGAIDSASVFVPGKLAGFNLQVRL